MDTNLLWFIVSALLTIVSVLLAVKWLKAKALLKEIAEALTVTSDALADDKITDGERNKILQEWADVIAAAGTLVGR